LAVIGKALGHQGYRFAVLGLGLAKEVSGFVEEWPGSLRFYLAEEQSTLAQLGHSLGVGFVGRGQIATIRASGQVPDLGTGAVGTVPFLLVAMAFDPLQENDGRGGEPRVVKTLA
jgi:hypothetical protein